MVESVLLKLDATKIATRNYHVDDVQIINKNDDILDATFYSKT